MSIIKPALKLLLKIVGLPKTNHRNTVLYRLGKRDLNTALLKCN